MPMLAFDSTYVQRPTMDLQVPIGGATIFEIEAAPTSGARFLVRMLRQDRACWVGIADARSSLAMAIAAGSCSSFLVRDPLSGATFAGDLSLRVLGPVAGLVRPRALERQLAEQSFASDSIVEARVLAMRRLEPRDADEAMIIPRT